jgi:hypothetical protein
LPCEIEQSLVGEDGQLYCVGEGYAMSFELPSCKQRWKTFFSKQDALLREVKAMTGPLFQGDDGQTWYMMGTTPVKIPRVGDP